MKNCLRWHTAPKKTKALKKKQKRKERSHRGKGNLDRNGGEFNQ